MSELKTIKQVADELGLDKQRVYRYIKKHCISDVHHIDAVMYITDAVQTRIKSHFCSETASSDVHHITSGDAILNEAILALREQLAEKDRQLQAKDEQIASLHRIIEQQNTLAAADKPTMFRLAGRDPGEGEQAVVGEDPGGGEPRGPRKWYQFWR